MEWEEVVKKALAYDLMEALESNPTKETYTKEELKLLIKNCVDPDGQTDSQFKAFLRFVLDALKDAETEQDEKKRTEKMKKILDNLQKSLED